MQQVTVCGIFLFRDAIRSASLQGVGASFTMITAMAWVRDSYEGDVAGKWLSYMGEGVTSAVPTIAPVIGSGLAALCGGGQVASISRLGLALLLFIMSAIALQSKKEC
ncbi:hypothetical protein OH492_18175 [Vibrio chagasii]|nr:hypothetical protein [Vibrio chagasii]